MILYHSEDTVMKVVYAGKMYKAEYVLVDNVWYLYIPEINVKIEARLVA